MFLGAGSQGQRRGLSGSSHGKNVHGRERALRWIEMVEDRVESFSCHFARDEDEISYRNQFYDR